MGRATRYHAMSSVALACGLVLLGLVGWESFGRLKAQALRDRVLEATTAEVPALVLRIQ